MVSIMSEVSVSIPQDLIRILKISERDLPRMVRLYLVIELYREGKISLGKAAEIAGITRWEMMEVLSSKGVPLQYDEDDLKEDIDTLERVL
ncbi:UPF0175 family protein [Thermococcus sp. MV5]|uniref:UPF0175 family protein n=1 Tax=Thermococcus sp. MV5 TaxID=1638272 RepID=UPI001F0CEF7A|nr:UPF0175 family protein [Thermococcus sp. MV5]